MLMGILRKVKGRAKNQAGPASAFTVHGSMRLTEDAGFDFFDHCHTVDGGVYLVAADVCGEVIPAELLGLSA